MKKVWVLASLLTSMLNAFFLGGSIPAWRQLGASHASSQEGLHFGPCNLQTPLPLGSPCTGSTPFILNTRYGGLV